MNGRMLEIIPSLPQCVALIRTLACIGVILDGAEILHARNEYRRGGIYDWELLRTMRPWTSHGRLSPLMNTLFRSNLAVSVTRYVCNDRGKSHRRLPQRVRRVASPH